MAGFFYPADRDELLDNIRECFRDKKIGPGVPLPESSSYRNLTTLEKGIECFIVPHAGYTYSGPVAAHSYSKANEVLIARTKSITAIILGPNHYGIGSGIALSPSTQWETPLGTVKVNQDFSREIADRSQIIDIDEMAHSKEHSIEVQIPFLQSLCQEKNLQIVPICLMLQDKESADDVSQAIFDVLQSERHSHECFLILGSSDLTHYEPASRANVQDMKLLEKVESLDVISYYSVLERLNVTACGYGAIAVVMSIARKLGRKQGKLLRHATSGDVTGDQSSVVGYSSVHFV